MEIKTTKVEDVTTPEKHGLLRGARALFVGLMSQGLTHDAAMPRREDIAIVLRGIARDVEYVAEQIEKGRK